jgi:peptidoglycan/LPS O-acetylase OafA/YrhL
MADRARRRATWFTALITVISVWEAADLLMMGHTKGWAIFGPVTAALAAVAGVVSLAYLTMRARRRVATIGLVALWLFVALAGYEGFSAHRHAITLGADTQPPAVAPLLFTALGIAGATVLRYGTKGQ